MTEQRHHKASRACMVWGGVTNFNDTETQHWLKSITTLILHWSRQWIKKPTETSALAQLPLSWGASMLLLAIILQGKCEAQYQQWQQELQDLYNKSRRLIASAMCLCRLWQTMANFGWKSGSVNLPNEVFFHHFYSRITVAHIFKINGGILPYKNTWLSFLVHSFPVTTSACPTYRRIIWTSQQREIDYLLTSAKLHHLLDAHPKMVWYHTPVTVECISLSIIIWWAH